MYTFAIGELTSPRLDWPRVGLSANCPVSVILHLRDERTNEQTDNETRISVRPSVRSFVYLFARLSVVSVSGVHPMGERSAMLHGNLRGRGLKIRDQPINTRNLVSWPSEKSLKFCRQMSHSKAKCTQFDSWRLSVRSSLRRSLTLSAQSQLSLSPGSYFLTRCCRHLFAHFEKTSRASTSCGWTVSQVGPFRTVANSARL